MNWTMNHFHGGSTQPQVLFVTVAPGEAISLPQNIRIEVQSVSGTAHITHTGRDLILWRGDSEQLERVSHVWGAPVLTALGKHPATITIKTEGSEAAWNWWIQRQKTTAGEKATTPF